MSEGDVMHDGAAAHARIVDKAPCLAKLAIVNTLGDALLPEGSVLVNNGCGLNVY